MPKNGDMISGKTIGKHTTNRYIWSSCIDCGKSRWVCMRHGLPSSLRCNSCAVKNRPVLLKGYRHHQWKGGKVTNHNYVLVWVPPDDFFAPMRNAQGYVREHRIVVARQLGRCLHMWEIVHHKNHIRDDNRIENLQLVSDDRHKQITILEIRIKHLEQRVTALESENILIRSQLTRQIEEEQLRDYCPKEKKHVESR
jgi:hypothetical protein